MGFKYKQFGFLFGFLGISGGTCMSLAVVACNDESRQVLTNIEQSLRSLNETSFDGNSFQNLRFSQETLFDDGRFLGITLQLPPNVEVLFTKDEDFIVDYRLRIKSEPSIEKHFKVPFLSSKDDKLVIKSVQDSLMSTQSSSLSQRDFFNTNFDPISLEKAWDNLGIASPPSMIMSAVEVKVWKGYGLDLNYTINLPLGHQKLAATFHEFEVRNGFSSAIENLKNELLQLKTTSLNSEKFIAASLVESDFREPSISQELGVIFPFKTLPYAIKSLKVSKLANLKSLSYQVVDEQNNRQTFNVAFSQSISDMLLLEQSKLVLSQVQSTLYNKDDFLLINSTNSTMQIGKNTLVQRLGIIGNLKLSNDLRIGLFKKSTELVARLTLSVGQWHRLSDFEITFVKFGAF